ncbi:APC family permease [Stackebrandtia nassauensis]|uniref:Amino acid permease-associated region n=1 Tax=Stackebrandtia nassauensis (strain DSM 44728 / CIP 108903 / NRRL B-16338 / NBRC 102104 / LLR-40K-21) TaxID=446470 RepID=D3Q9L3_STANL|nr:APC family permease [Stackebrandtia nassauensis]ADD44559.1 amino acid permease-associated region [Stackebrandtia nassauensis DSM 44728]
MSTTDGIERFGYRQELRRTVGFADLVFYGLIFMVPIAPFGIFGTAFQISHGMVALAYLVALIALMFTAWSYARMSAEFPMTGGVYNYAGRGISAPVGFLSGWMILLDYLLLPILLYIIAAIAMASIVPAVPVWIWLLVFIAVNTVINATGMKMTIGVIRLFIVGEMLVLALFLVLGVSAVLSGKAEFSFDPIFNPGEFSFGLVLGAASITVLSFLGFDGIALLAEENRGRAKQLGRAMALALMLAGLLFIAQTWVAALLVPDPEALINADPSVRPADQQLLDNAFYNSAEVAGGSFLFTTCALATALAWGIADTMVAQVASSRLIYAMARDRQLPRFLSKVSVRFAVPTNAIYLAAALSLVVGMTVFEFAGAGPGIFKLLGITATGNSVGFLTSIINFGAICSFLALHVAVIWHFVFKKRSRRLFSDLVIPLCGLGVLGSVAYFNSAPAQFTGLVWLGIGLIILIGLYVAGRKPTLTRTLDEQGDSFHAAPKRHA